MQTRDGDPGKDNTGNLHYRQETLIGTPGSVEAKGLQREFDSEWLTDVISAAEK